MLNAQWKKGAVVVGLLVLSACGATKTKLPIPNTDVDTPTVSVFNPTTTTSALSATSQGHWKLAGLFCGDQDVVEIAEDPNYAGYEIRSNFVREYHFEDNGQGTAYCRIDSYYTIASDKISAEGEAVDLKLAKQTKQCYAYESDVAQSAPVDIGLNGGIASRSLVIEQKGVDVNNTFMRHTSKEEDNRCIGQDASPPVRDRLALKKR